MINLPKGFKAGGIACGINPKKKKKDLGLVYSPIPAQVTGVFTTNKVKAAPVILSIEKIKKGWAQAIIVNSGNANACTGKQGLKDADQMTSLTAKYLGIGKDKVLVGSTGVIGVKLPMPKIIKGIKKLTKIKKNAVYDFIEAIITTDTKHKILTKEFMLHNKKITICGLAKGSGMIYPRLATMLVFILTDAAITQVLLKKSLQNAVEKSFNLITVDGDTSTNDMVIIMANGLVKNKLISSTGKDFDNFQDKLNQVCLELSKMIAQDGEGASKFIEIEVAQASTFTEARKVALAIANSNLVKTAIFGNDPNWGRIMAAAGNAGVKINPDKIDIQISNLKKELTLAKNGQEYNFSQIQAIKILKNRNIKILVKLNCGQAKACSYTCDLTPDYIKINAHYRT